MQLTEARYAGPNSVDPRPDGLEWCERRRVVRLLRSRHGYGGRRLHDGQIAECSDGMGSTAMQPASPPDKLMTTFLLTTILR